jgi:hypothetical protein
MRNPSGLALRQQPCLVARFPGERQCILTPVVPAGLSFVNRDRAMLPTRNARNGYAGAPISSGRRTAAGTDGPKIIGIALPPTWIGKTPVCRDRVRPARASCPVVRNRPERRRPNGARPFFIGIQCRDKAGDGEGARSGGRARSAPPPWLGDVRGSTSPATPQPVASTAKFAACTKVPASARFCCGLSFRATAQSAHCSFP